MTDVDPRLPPTTLGPGYYGDGYCCGWGVHVRGPVRYRTADLNPPPHTINRWTLVYEWQCDRDPSHNGEWWTTTDDETPVSYPLGPRDGG